ncbi:MAG: GTPase Era [Bacilli bacterium]
MKSGFVGIIGRPNVGKSTLLNSIIGKKIAIVSNKSQTTRNNIQGIYNDRETQIIFLDTPGIHKPLNKLGRYLNKQAYISLNDIDVVLFMIDASEHLGKGDKFVLTKLKEITTPVILVLNKIDKLNKEEIIKKIEEYKDLYNFEEIIPISALNKDNINTLIKLIKKFLKDNTKYYHNNEITIQSSDFIISELIREKVLELTEEEIPHSIACIVEKIKEKKDIVEINAVIVVERDSQKKIIIGKQGQMIKEIGIKARLDIEDFYNKKVYLELFVQVKKNWRDKDKYLNEFGYNIK